MSEETQRAVEGHGAFPTHESEQLAQWLLRLMREPLSASVKEGIPRELRSSKDHCQLYQQLPDFVMALLLQDASAPERYAPLLYHLVACDSCHSAYLEVYDAMRAALDSRHDSRGPEDR